MHGLFKPIEMICSSNLFAFLFNGFYMALNLKLTFVVLLLNLSSNVKAQELNAKFERGIISTTESIFSLNYHKGEKICAEFANSKDKKDQLFSKLCEYMIKVSRNQLDKISLNHYNKIIKECDINGFKEIKLLAILGRASFLFNNGSYQESEKDLKLLLNSNLDYIHAEANYLYGLCMDRNGKVDGSAKQYFLNAFNSKYSKQNRVVYLNYLNGYTMSLEQKKDYDEKLKNYRTLSSVGERYPSISANAYANLASLYAQSNKLDSALHFIDTAINISKRVNRDFTSYLGTKANILLSKNELTLARQQYRLQFESLKSKNSVDHYEFAVNQMNYGLTFFQENPDSSIYYLNIAENNAKNLTNYKLRQFILRKKAFLQYKNNMFKEAYENISQVASLKDSFFDNTLRKDIEELNIKFKIRDKEYALSEAENKIITQTFEKEKLTFENKLKKSENAILILKNENYLDSLNKNLIQMSLSETELDILEKDNLLNRQTIREEKFKYRFTLFALLFLILITYYFLTQNRKLKERSSQIAKQKDQIQLLHQELNHRVKNNLSFMTSLVEMQGRRTKNVEAREILQETESRLGALSLVHSNLFKNDEATTVNLALYLEELVSQLEKIFAIPGKELIIICNLIDHQVNAEDAMRLGLIVNELVTNSIKHAFAHVNEPQINIATKLDNKGKLTLEYKDNGPGHIHVSNFTADETNEHLGTKLIALLKEQLKDRYTLVC